MRRRAIAAAFAAVCLAPVLAAPGGASTPGRNGLIVFSESVRGRFHLFTVRPDGTGVRQITRIRGADAYHPDWSPDGSWIVFELDRPGGPLFCSVAIVRADGSGLRLLSHGRTCEGQPAFTPDGRRIVRYANQTDLGSLWSMNAAGGDRRRIAPQRALVITDPNVSPDGSWITFVGVRRP